MLVFLMSTYTLRSRLSIDEESRNKLDELLDPSGLDWFALSQSLNLVVASFPIASRTERYANIEAFPQNGVPLFEDYAIRGLVWSQWYFAPDWFANLEDDDGSRCLEDHTKKQHRAARMLYLGMILAQISGYLSYDRETRCFSSAIRLDVEDSSLATQSPQSLVGNHVTDSFHRGSYV